MQINSQGKFPSQKANKNQANQNELPSLKEMDMLSENKSQAMGKAPTEQSQKQLNNQLDVMATYNKFLIHPDALPELSPHGQNYKPSILPQGNEKALRPGESPTFQRLNLAPDVEDRIRRVFGGTVPSTTLEPERVPSCVRDRELNHMDYTSQNLSGDTYTNCNFLGSLFQSTNLSFSTLANNNYTGVVANDINLMGASIDHCNFTSAFLTNALLMGSNIRNTNFSTPAPAHLQGANFGSATLDSNNFSGVNLTGTMWGQSLVRNCDFTNANLTGADLRNADLSTCNLTGANLTGVRCNRRTIFPSDFDTTGITFED